MSTVTKFPWELPPLTEEQEAKLPAIRELFKAHEENILSFDEDLPTEFPFGKTRSDGLVYPDEWVPHFGSFPKFFFPEGLARMFVTSKNISGNPLKKFTVTLQFDDGKPKEGKPPGIAVVADVPFGCAAYPSTVVGSAFNSATKLGGIDLQVDAFLAETKYNKWTPALFADPSDPMSKLPATCRLYNELLVGPVRRHILNLLWEMKHPEVIKSWAKYVRNTYPAEYRSIKKDTDPKIMEKMRTCFLTFHKARYYGYSEKQWEAPKTVEKYKVVAKTSSFVPNDYRNKKDVSGGDIEFDEEIFNEGYVNPEFRKTKEYQENEKVRQILLKRAADNDYKPREIYVNVFEEVKAKKKYPDGRTEEVVTIESCRKPLSEYPLLSGDNISFPALLSPNIVTKEEPHYPSISLKLLSDITVYHRDPRSRRQKAAKEVPSFMRAALSVKKEQSTQEGLKTISSSTISVNNNNNENAQHSDADEEEEDISETSKKENGLSAEDVQKKKRIKTSPSPEQSAEDESSEDVKL